MDFNDLHNLRIEEIKKLGEEIEKRKNELGNLKDIRFRNWMQLDTKVSKALKLLIELEDIFYDIDKFSLDNDQCYPEFEHFMLQIGGIRKDFTDCVDKDITLLDIK